MPDDAYRPRSSALELSIGLTAADVVGLPGYGRTTFAIDGARAIDGATPVVTDVVANGLKRIVDYYVLGMHAAYGLSNFAEPVPFLLALRRLTDDVFAAVRRAAGGEALVDASDGNAELAAIVRALYPEVFDPAPPPGAPAPAPTGPVAAPVIVVGCARSGTTWLQRMLQSHPSLAGPDGETCLITSVRDVLANDALRAYVQRDDIVRAVRSFGSELCAHWQARHAPGALRLVEKTPSNVNYLDTIAELFPDASVIGIYRDGRDVVASLLAVEFGPDDAVSASQGWVQSLRAMHAFATRSQQIRVVRYEELRAEPVAQLVALLQWLDLPADDAVQKVLAAQAGEQVSQHHAGTHGLSPRDARAVYRLGGELLVELGYATEADVRAVKRQPGNALDAARRGAARLMRHR